MQKKGERDWWLVTENGEIDLCLNEPGYDVDIVIKCSLKTMTEIWICQKNFRDAVKKGDIKVLGDQKLTSKLQDWLRSSQLAKLGTIDKLPELAWNIS